MIAALLSWLGGGVAGPLAGAVALVFAGGFLWQSARIDGLPLLGGGLKAQLAALEKDVAGRDLALAKAQATAMQARLQGTAKGEAEAASHAAAQAKTESQIQRVIEKVPVYVTPKAAAACTLPWGFVRLLDAAASGADPDTVRAAIAPGQPDDAASDVGLPEAAALLAVNLGIARQNADQLAHLEKAVAAP
jgi:hypothetical protein